MEDLYPSRHGARLATTFLIEWVSDIWILEALKMLAKWSFAPKLGLIYIKV
jgi:hypothetical protein